MTQTWLTGARIFDGTAWHEGCALQIDDATVVGIIRATDIPVGGEVTQLDGGILAPGFVDLQVNGGDGVMFNNAPSVDTLRRMAKAHARIGATGILSTLITDTPQITAAAITAVQDAIAQGISGIIGLHLEGPHLVPAKKGAHDAGLIRPMTKVDLEMLCDAARDLPVLMVTIAPEIVTPDQIATLTRAGVIVSLGHSNADFDTCQRAAEAGARCVTHLFNAQSGLAAREPGVVGAALTDGRLSAGLIADAIHVHPATIRAAMRAKQGPGEIFLVSDAMATAGSDCTSFTLNGREIRRAGDRLALSDGTLAGAHLELARALRVLTGQCGIDAAQALSMATAIPARVIGATKRGHLEPGARADLVHLDADLHLRAVWQGGQPAPL